MEGVGVTTSSATATCVDFGSSTSNLTICDTMLLSGPAGAIGFDGLTASGNIITNSIGRISGANFTGAITPLNNLTTDDIRWRFKDNDQIQDTKQRAFLSVTANATETVITTASVPVKVAATFTVEVESFFSGDTNGRITYTGEVDLPVEIGIDAFVRSASGTNKDVIYQLLRL